ncbi:hypothetical protein L226DRAFT_567972 [Lentinus tigrinus ALCF2SS1-7]|uniref:uncharacterized protein n=1 Tax=Lentinus tigrinus ALCF2SS1-7 TaxID=1328758 RepID=UPI00116635A3|nr:hypothetical protein L226DRAFT_567972 [Lentinus tigrinus ALCF2SS1-7]
MDIPRPSSAARRSAMGIPSKPDASLAEWTSKIKALQKQVDEDEEVETRRLEAEIAASRQARLRRSTNLGSRTNSVDLSQGGLAAVIKVDDRSVVSDEPLTAKEKQRNQDDALRKLMGESPTHRAPNRSPAPTAAPAPPAALNKRPSSPISLAAFIGGRATGPRLTKQAPQQDAHDPTQFEQRTHISAPHPVFGRGGVAMPGMTGHGTASVVSRAIREEEARSSPSSSTLQRDRRISTPSTVSSVRAAVEKAPERDREIIPSHTGSSQAAFRQRTISTPTGVALSKPTAPAETFSTKPKADPVPRPLSHSPNPTIIRPITPRTTGSVVSSGSKSPAPRPSSAALHTPPPPSVSPKPLPGLARPIQPTPRPSFGSPQMPPSHNPSPAFLKLPPAKEPTPSLSRLQGRGFVKNMVEKTASIVSPESSPIPDKSLSPGGRRQSSVLDRWQHTGSGTPTPPAVISPKPMPLRKSFTVDPAQTSPTASSYSVPLKRDSTGPLLKSKTSLPLLPTMKTGDSVGGFSSVSESAYNGPKLGSAKTVITYIQPTKTGDEPSPPLQTHRTGDVDELGMRVRTRTTSGGLVQEQGAAGLPEGTSGKPLSHPTKDRAKKPRKSKSAPTRAAGASKLTAIREASPPRDNTTAARSSSLQTASERSASAFTPPQTVRTTSPTSQYPSPPSTNGRSVSATTMPPKPIMETLEVHTSTPTSSAKTSPTSSLAAPPASRSPSVTPPQSKVQKPPSSPRHARIPSTGNRATVMDVAQAFTEALHHPPSSPVVDSPAEVHGPSRPPSLGASHATKAPEEEGKNEPPSVRNMVVNWGPRSGGTNGAPTHGSQSTSRTTTITAPPLEKRKSSYEKYSAFIMPPLAEERTPVPSPAGTLKQDAAPDPALLEEEEIEVPKADKTEVAQVIVQVQGMVPELKAQHPAPVEAPQAKASAKDELTRLAHSDEPLPHVNVEALYRAPRTVYKPDPDVMTISVDVMAIVGSTATAVSVDAHVFYDSEVLAFIHRAKVKSSGLVATKVWAWHGKRAQAGDKEFQKVQELARRYGTTPITVEQAREPPEFVSVLGGTFATRQGTRAHWSAENTAMHLVRSLQGLVFIDELDLSIKNLCSGYSYCISILGTFYVWHGRGSTTAEQRAALGYAQSLAPSTESVVEFTEEESHADEMFWMILGEGDYAKADYWKWRPAALIVDPRAWIVDAAHSEVVRPIAGFPSHPEFSQAVFLVDCVWELFVVIGSEARGRRLEIRLALHVAHALAAKASSTRPFTPTVHALIFPTQIPTDLLLTFRELDESTLNSGDIPDHMNLIPASDAEADLKSAAWTSAALQDHTMLPLGVNPAHLC